MDKKYYWLKLKKDFFKRHDIKIIENMPNGKDYVLFYLKLLLESIDHEGSLRFSDTIPYNEQMLATVTDTNIDIVRSALQIFRELGLVDIFDDKTLYMTEVSKMTGSETVWAEKQRRYRIAHPDQKKDIDDTLSDTLYHQVDTMSDKSKSKRKSIDIDKDKEKEIDTKVSTKKKKTKAFVPPTVEEVEAYCRERGNNIDGNVFVDFYASKGWMVGSNKMTDWKAAVRTWERNNKNRQTNDNHRYQTAEVATNSKKTDDDGWEG